MEEVASPCLGDGRINIKAGYCEGCYRTRQEIADWPQLHVEQKRQVLQLLPRRRGDGETC